MYILLVPWSTSHIRRNIHNTRHMQNKIKIKQDVVWYMVLYLVCVFWGRYSLLRVKVEGRQAFRIWAARIMRRCDLSLKPWLLQGSQWVLLFSCQGYCHPPADTLGCTEQTFVHPLMYIMSLILKNVLWDGIHPEFHCHCQEISGQQVSALGADLLCCPQPHLGLRRQMPDTFTL